MTGWHHLLDGHESEQTPGDSEGQGSLVSCSSWGCRVRHDLVTEREHSLKPDLVPWNGTLLSFACLRNQSYLGVFFLISYGNQSTIRHIFSSFFFSSYSLNMCFVFIEETGPHSARTGPSRSVLHPCLFGGGEGKRMERNL